MKIDYKHIFGGIVLFLILILISKLIGINDSIFIAGFFVVCSVIKLIFLPFFIKIYKDLGENFWRFSRLITFLLSIVCLLQGNLVAAGCWVFVELTDFYIGYRAKKLSTTVVYSVVNGEKMEKK